MPTPADPRTLHSQPDTAQGQGIPHPGLTDDMSDRPDHGEESYKGTGKMTDRRAVITGGDSGIGRAVAIAFAREGADVLIAYLPEEEQDAQETVRLIQDAGRKAVSVPGDIREEEHCRLIIDTAVRELGGIDVLVNNAAYQQGQPGGIEDITTEQWDRVLKTNLYALFWLTKMAVPHLRPGSSIINTASIQATEPAPELLDYATTKAGIVNFGKGLAQNAGREGDPGEHRGTRADLDPAHSGHHECGKGRGARHDHAAGAGRPTGRGGTGVRVLRFAASQFHHRRDPRRHRRHPGLVIGTTLERHHI